MNRPRNFSIDRFKYLSLLSMQYPSIRAVCTEIINLQSVLNLPKGTEHFMSDLHGEYQAFFHILNNCSGVIREKVKVLFGDELTHQERSELCTLIYYPEEKLERLKSEGKINNDWYKMTIRRLIELVRFLSSKYPRNRVREAMPKEYSFIIDELLHAQQDEDNNQLVYHEKIIETLIGIENSDEFITAIAELIKKLAVDTLHIVGDIFDRGARPDTILDMLANHYSVDVEWGNHDILWLGAGAGSEVCIMGVIRNSVSYRNMAVLENGYGISLRSLILFAEKLYPEKESMEALMEEISVLMFKLEGQVIKRHPEYEMDDRLLMDKVDRQKNMVIIDGREYPSKEIDWKTVNPENPYELTAEETEIIAELKKEFAESERLNRHIAFLYAKGSIYRIFNGNLLFHGCMPLNEDGSFAEVEFDGQKYSGKSYMDYADDMVRLAYFSDNRNAKDFMWFLWCGEKSPLSGRKTRTFARTYCLDKTTWAEPDNPYFRYCNDEKTCCMILEEFDLSPEYSHIINGHTPVKVVKGESPVKAGGKLIVIDGGFCKAYQKTTGIAGYTLIANSHGLRIMSHQPFLSVEKALDENKDIHSHSDIFETYSTRMMVADSDTGKVIKEQISDLKDLLTAYRSGIFAEKE